jgi:hypothetical protein
MEIYTWKCHNEIPCVDALNKQKCLSLKTENSKVKQTDPVWEWVPVGGERIKERV